MSNLNSHDWKENIPVDAVWSKTDRERYQEKLNQVLGVEPDGTPRLRLVWGADFSKTLTRNRFNGLYYPRYEWTRKFDPVKDGLSFVGVPRFFIEIFNPVREVAHEYGAGGESPLTEAGVLDNGERYDAADYESIQWVTHHAIFDHSPFTDNLGRPLCCVTQHRTNQHCYGQFRLPSDKDIDALREAHWKTAQLREARFGEALTEKDQQTLHRIALTETMQAEIKKLKEEQSDREYEARRRRFDLAITIGH